MGGDGADTMDFVGSNRNAEAGAADEDGAISFAIGNLVGGISVARVRCVVGYLGGI